MAGSLSAGLLDQLRLMAEKTLGSTVTNAVITVPGYFTMPQREATITAALIAGFTGTICLLNEATAAVLAYGGEKAVRSPLVTDEFAARAKAAGGSPLQYPTVHAGQQHTLHAARDVLVYDLGGGHLQVSVLELRDERTPSAGHVRVAQVRPSNRLQ